MRYSPWWSMALWAGFLFGSCQMVATPLACPDNNFLNAYIDLGVTGCTIDDKVFSNFVYGQGRQSPVGSTDVGVLPLNDYLNPGLLFESGAGGPNSPMWAATSSPVLNYTVRVQPGGSPIYDNTLGIQGVSVSGDGSVTVTEYECLGALFTGPMACPGMLAQLSAFVTPTGTQLSQVVNFAPVLLVDVQTYLSLNATRGAATLEGFREQFSEVPEPGTWGWLGAGITTLVLLRRRLTERTRN